MTIIWDVKKNGSPLTLTDKDLTLYMTHARGREMCEGVVVNGSTITFVFDGLDQKVLGKYTLTADIKNKNGQRVLITDKCNAFTLVGRSCVEQPEDGNYVIYL